MKDIDSLSTTKIYKTKNYTQFWLIKGNRKITQNHLKDLTLSIMSNNLLDYNPIVVTEDKGIIDGQHRLEVARNNRLSLSYIIAPGANIDQVRQLNRYNKRWNGYDFIYSYATLGNKEYQWLLSFMEAHDVPYSTALILIFGENRPSRIVNGLMTIPEVVRKKAVKRGNTLISIRPFITKKGQIPNGFIAAINKISDQDKEKEVINGIAQAERIYPKVVVQEAYQQLLSFIK